MKCTHNPKTPSGAVSRPFSIRIAVDRGQTWLQHLETPAGQTRRKKPPPYPQANLTASLPGPSTAHFRPFLTAPVWEPVSGLGSVGAASTLFTHIGRHLTATCFGPFNWPIYPERSEFETGCSNNDLKGSKEARRQAALSWTPSIIFVFQLFQPSCNLLKVKEPW